ncbi:MAG: 2OG-Fe(II) oxygenase [Pseudomonadota bacterium]
MKTEVQLNSIRLIDNFFPSAGAMRDHYDKAFANPLKASQDRFQWDYWNVPDQYCLHRAPAHLFFPEDLYADFESALCQWGGENLGSNEISTPWISYYVHGGEQRLHADNPHGPWAYVYSLTNWSEAKFEGGLTQILSESVLDYWNSAQFSEGLESPQLFDAVEPEFNRLCVFDPRKPHGVTRVHGSMDPREARVVLHGWFLRPQPMIDGGLEEVDISEELGAALNPALDQIDEFGSYNGYVLFHLEVPKQGGVAEVKRVLSTLRAISLGATEVSEVEMAMEKALSNAEFPASEKDSVLSLPLVFE